MKHDGSLIDLGDILVNGRIGNALARFLRHGSDGLAIAGSIALAAQSIRLYGERIDRAFGDIDFVAPTLDMLSASLMEEFICPHVHGAAEPGRTLAQFVHSDDAVRIDIFRAIGFAQSRTTPFRIGTTWIEILSLEDQAARTASVCMKLTRGGTAVAKHFLDFLWLQRLVSSDRIDAVWHEYRREFEPLRFVDVVSQIEAAVRTHPERLIVAAFNRGVNTTCPNCGAWGDFRPAEPARVIRILGYA